MADNKGRIDNIHDQMPALLNTRNNTNWSAIIEAIGEQDQTTLELIEAVRQQFFVKTASRPYIDKLAAASSVQRPRFIGMSDQIFREFIPVMSYRPKQVKLILDELLDLFFFKDATTSFVMSTAAEPFSLVDGWELLYNVDSSFDERIKFIADDFTDITNATANEIVAAINRQAEYSYAIAFEDSITKQTNIRIFTNTVGSKGAIEITGGRANIGLRFDGWNTEAGQGLNSEWTITKVGDRVTMTYTGVGNSPNVDSLEAGDIVIIDRPGNEGSFVITNVDPSTDSIQFTNLFATPETFTENGIDQVKFMSPFKSNVFLRDRRAVVWEIRPGEVIVEMPSSPPVVRRNRKGAAHLNGVQALGATILSPTSLELDDASNFLDAGKFSLEEIKEIQTYYPGDGDTTQFQYKTRLSSCQPVYTYTSKVGNVLSGITPALPTLSSLNTFNLVSANRNASNIITVTTVAPNDIQVGEQVIISDAVLGAGTGVDVNGTWIVTKVNNTTEFECYSFSGAFGTKASTGGTVRVEREGIANSGFKVMLRTAQLQPNRLGPYLWDTSADFVLSSLTTDLTTEIEIGSSQRNIQVDPNDILDEPGRLIFDYGTEKQEGPVRYFFKSSETSIAIDPAYVFKYTHDAGSAVTMIRKRGGIEFDGRGSEFAPYITDPTAARVVLQELMQEVKSVGIFINFLIRYPQQFYSTIDVYFSGIDPDIAENEQP
jgi:hypothetical protein